MTQTRAAFYLPISLWLALLCLAAWALRLPLLARFPLREDEAVYAYWALHFLYEDPFFLQVWPDKPPIFLWALAAVFGALTPDSLQGEALARWINLAASIATIPLVAATARRWWGPQGGVAAAALLAFNPFAIAFAPTVYTDPVLVLAGAAALCLTVHKRWFWAGVWLGVAVMTKQQGVLYAPLILGVALVSMRRMQWGRASLSAVGGVLVVIAPIVYWDSLRWAVAPSPWDLAPRNYTPLALAPVGDWLSRSQAWAEWLWYLGGAWPAWLVLATLFVMALAAARQKSKRKDAMTPRRKEVFFATLRPGDLALRCENGGLMQRRWLSAPVVAALWSAGFLAGHVLTTVQIWDRYLLPLAPMLALGAGWAIEQVMRAVLSWLERSGSSLRRSLWTNQERGLAWWPDGRVGLSLPVGADAALAAWTGRYVGLPLATGAVILICLLPPAWHAAQGRFPIGADHGDYAGLHEALAWLDAHAGPRYILYHQALGWHYRYYLFDEIRARQVELRWFSGPPGLADNAAKMPFPPKYLLMPAWSPQPDLPLHLRTRGLIMQTRLRAGKFTVVEIMAEPRPACDWCLCAPPTTPNWSTRVVEPTDSRPTQCLTP